MFIPLKITTDYSLLKSMIKVEDLIPFLKEKKIPAAAICDDNLYGVMDFYNSCLENQIKPIIGLTLVMNDLEYYCYAKNYHGYQNLLKIHTIKETREVTKEDLVLYHDELKIIIPYECKELYDNLNSIFKEIYIGYSSYYEKNNALLITEKIVYIKNLKALYEKDGKYLDFLKMIKEGTTKSEIEEGKYEKNYFSLEDIEEEDIKTTQKFIIDIDIKIQKNTRFIPHFDQKISDSIDYLVSLAKKGLLKRLNNNPKENYIKRLKYELTVIQKMGFVDYFLIVYDYVRYAKKNDILVGPGRGSAAGSLVSYALGITEVDPMKYDLLFERFLNPDRITMPDIDIDFEYTKREKVIKYVKERYGKDAVAGIMTFGTLGSKLVLRDIGKCLELDQTLINKFVGNIDPKKTLNENLENPHIKQIIQNNETIQQWYKISQKIEGLKRHISTHAAGVVISSTPLDNVIPICYSGEEMLTGVTMNYLEDLGLLKMDFLALRNLTIIQNVIDLIKKDTEESIKLNQIDLNDKNVLKLFETADTTGIFQFESVGMIHFLEKLKPTSFDDLVASLALYRPGPMQNIDSFIRRREGKEKVDYLDKDLEPILKETYGIIVYQEQIMQILSRIGGFSFAESDNIRRAMSKKKKEVIEEAATKFIAGAIQKGYQKEVAIKIYDLILKFANYGFNKAHSVSYAMIGYQMAYLKVNYPIYYIANLLNMSINSSEKTKEYLMEAKKRNYKILHPDINKSLESYRIMKNSLLLPLSVIKNLGSEAVITILEEREKNGAYQDFFDFAARTYGKSINRKTIECLIDAGAFYQIENSYETLKENIDSAINYATLIHNLDQSLIKEMDDDLIIKPTLKRVEEKDTDERKREIETFGFYLSNHPSSKFNHPNITKLETMEKHFDKMIKCVVVIEQIRSIETKKKEPMAFIQASDETECKDFVVFPKIYPLIQGLKKNDLILVEGRVTKRLDKYQINVTNITRQ